MNPLTLLFRLPLLPLQGVLRLGELLQEEAERQLRDPATVRRELEQIQQAAESGQMSEEEAAQMQEEAVTRFTGRLVGQAEDADGSEG